MLNRMRVRARDDLADIFARRLGAIHKRASEELEVIQRRQRAQVEDLVVLLDGVVDILVDQSDETTIAKSIRKWLAPKGDLEPLREKNIAAPKREKKSVRVPPMLLAAAKKQLAYFAERRAAVA